MDSAEDKLIDTFLGGYGPTESIALEEQTIATSQRLKRLGGFNAFRAHAQTMLWPAVE